jgi:hypothetical protein
MEKVHCRLIVHSNSWHLQHLYTGFFLLSKLGLIYLKQTIITPKVLNNPQIQPSRDTLLSHLDVVLNGKKVVHYDTHDGYRIHEQSLRRSDYYFKRSLSRTYVANMLEGGNKVRPLGLYYPVFPCTLDFYSVQRNFLLGKGIHRLSGFKTHGAFSSFRFLPNISNTWSVPDYDLDPKILFMVRAWDPMGLLGGPIDKIQERERINEMRTNCIKLLRTEFGNKFYGGFIHTDFAKRRYAEYLMPDNTCSIKRNYFNLLRTYPICVATSGLHRSIGAKFAEYIAFSRAILSEKLNYEVPGDLLSEKNYLEFQSPEECVSNAVRLFSDKQLRNELMRNNQLYYHFYLRPDSQVLRTITLALSGEEPFFQKQINH